MKRILLTSVISALLIVGFVFARVAVIAPGTVNPTQIPAYNANTDVQKTKLHCANWWA
jgi:hypothetical protein